MSAINSVQHQPVVPETTFCGSCLQALYDIVNKVREVFLAILQTIFPCFFSSGTLDASTVTQLSTGNTNQVLQSPAQSVQQAEAQLTQQPTGGESAAILLPPAPSGGQPVLPQQAPPQAGSHLPSAQHAHDDEPPAENANGQMERAVPGLLPVGGDGTANELVDGPPAGGSGAANELVDGPPAGGSGAANELVDGPPAGGSGAADELVDGPPAGGSGAANELVDGPPAGGSGAADELVDGPPAGGSGAADELVDELPAGVSSAAASAILQQAGSAVDGVVDENMDWSTVSPAAAATPPPRRDTLFVSPGAELPTDSSVALLGTGNMGDLSAMPPPARSSVTVIPPLPGNNSLFGTSDSFSFDTLDASPSIFERVERLQEQLKEVRAGRLTAEAMMSSQKGSGEDDEKEHEVQRLEIVGPKEEPVGFFSACALVIDWTRDFDQVIHESSEFDGILKAARDKFKECAKGADFLEIAKGGGMVLKELGDPRSRRQWVDALSAIAEAGKEPYITVWTNGVYSMSYALRIARDGDGFVYNLFSPNTAWDPAKSEKDPIYRLFTDKAALRAALPGGGTYRVYELTGVADYQHGNGTGSSDQFAAAAAAAALPPGGVHVEAAPDA